MVELFKDISILINMDYKETATGNHSASYIDT
jgi:hypothetical protein